MHAVSEELLATSLQFQETSLILEASVNWHWQHPTRGLAIPALAFSHTSWFEVV